MSENKINPANEGKRELPKGFRPMTSATLRLEVPDKDGWHRHWFRGTPERIARAKQAGYTFVDPQEVDTNNFDIAGDSMDSGSTDLGSAVSVISGDDIGNDGQPGRMYLMECPNEWYEEAQKVLVERNEEVASALRGGRIGMDGTIAGGDPSTQYRDKSIAIPDLFNPNKRRR